MRHHGESLRKVDGDPDAVVAFLGGDANAVRDALTRRVLKFAVKLTRTSPAMEAADLGALRQEGLSDAALHDVVSVVAYFNFVNRMALGLGVELEPQDTTA